MMPGKSHSFRIHSRLKATSIHSIFVWISVAPKSSLFDKYMTATPGHPGALKKKKKNYFQEVETAPPQQSPDSTQ